MVDHPHVVVLVEQTVSRLAVGVVGDHVEERDLRPRRHRGLIRAEEVASVGFDEQLDRADPVGSLAANHCGWDPGPAQDLAELVGRHLASVERPRCEIPQRRLAPRRLVHDPKRSGLLGS